MSRIFVFADKADAAAQLVSFARSLGGNCTVLACGEDSARYANVGAEQVLYLGSCAAETYAKATAEILREQQAELLATVLTASGREVAAKVAGLLDCPLVSNASSVVREGTGFTTERMLYGGSVIRQEHFEGPGVVTVPLNKYPPEEGACPVLELNSAADERVKIVNSEPIVKEGGDITSAERVVGAGMAFTTREELELAYQLAEALGAEVGCTRSLAEDQHWFSEYIGLSGVQINPKLYFALGVSGQVQHSVGVRGAQLIVAINRDEKAPILSACDYGVVGDLFKLVPKLLDALKK